jgi:hypothetical protein
MPLSCGWDDMNAAFTSYAGAGPAAGLDRWARVYMRRDIPGWGISPRAA